MADIKTWANGQKITPDDMKTYVSDALRGFMEAPACRRTIANQASEQKAAKTWYPVTLERVGSGVGATHSYDNTGGQMSKDPVKVVAPIDGLYELSFGIILRAVSGTLTYALAAANINQTNGGQIAAKPIVRTGCGRSSAAEKVGAGSATVALKAGDFVSLAVHADDAFYIGDGSYAQMISHFELRWVGVKP
ncbi:hypothetical protein [Streptomyces sp. NPDC002790]|uniref:hypothetical protein n=1 Tax=Streptomyces sp. NPDC002790 TaxID=3154431 RepID=UPI003329BA6E